MLICGTHLETLQMTPQFLSIQASLVEVSACQETPQNHKRPVSDLWRASPQAGGGVPMDPLPLSSSLSLNEEVGPGNQLGFNGNVCVSPLPSEAYRGGCSLGVPLLA